MLAGGITVKRLFVADSEVVDITYAWKCCSQSLGLMVAHAANTKDLHLIK